MKSLAIALATLVVATFACESSQPLTEPLAGNAGTTGAAGTSTAGTSTIGVAGTGAVLQGAGGTGSVIPPVTGTSCESLGDRYKPASMDAAKRAVTGTWALCSSVGLFHRQQAGIRIGADGQYALLEDRNGALVALTGDWDTGHVEYVDVSSDNPAMGRSFQINFVGNQGATIISLLVLSDDPRVMVINNNGVDEYRYSRLGTVGPNDGTTSGSNPPLDIEQRTGAQICRMPEGRYVPDGNAALAATVRGTWVLCSQKGLFARPQVGLYVGPDDRFVLLQEQNGLLVPLTGLENKGHVEYRDGRQTDFVGDLGGTIISAPVFTTNPRQMLLDNNGVEEYLYTLVQ